MNEIVTFEVVYDIQDKRGALKRYRKTFSSASEARAFYDIQINKPLVLDAFCTAKISSVTDDLNEQVTFRRVAQFYRK